MSTSVRTRAAVLGGVLALALTACSITTEPADGGATSADEPGTAVATTDTAAADDSTSEPSNEGEESPSADVLPEHRTWLYELDSDANFDSGGQVDVSIAGGDGAAHPDSTSQWLGCDGTAAVTTYALDGDDALLQGTLAFREGTPSDVVAEVQIETDLGVLGRYRVESDGGVPLRLVLEGADTLTVTAEVSAGDCGSDDVGYLVFADTFLS